MRTNRHTACVLAVLLMGSCRCAPSAPDDTSYYERVCKTAGMELIPGTHTCLGPDSSYINLQPPKR